MADTKISALTAATTPLTGTEQVPVVQSATSKQATVADLLGTYKVPARVATTAALTGTFTFSAGTFTWSASAPTTLDGVTLAVGDRILVKDEGANSFRNGVYVRTSSTVWDRAADASTAAELAAAIVHVTSGTTNGGTAWQTGLKSTDTTFNTTAAITWNEVLDTSQLASTNPAALGTAAPGTGTTLARADHVHPTTNLVPTGAITTSGLTQTTARILGRTTASTGAIEEITVGSGLTLSAGTLTASGSSSAELLTRVNRTTTTASSYTTTSTTTVDVDATNLAVTFTAPTSGAVLLRLTGTATISVSAGNYHYWSLRTGTTNVVGTERLVHATGQPTSVTAAILLTGLSSGTSYTYKWAWRGSAGTMTLYYGYTTEFSSTGINSALTMEVWSA